MVIGAFSNSRPVMFVRIVIINLDLTHFILDFDLTPFILAFYSLKKAPPSKGGALD